MWDLRGGQKIGYDRPLEIYLVTQDGKISSRSLMSLSMLCEVPINRLYSHPVTNDVLISNKVLDSTSRVHSGFRSKGGIHHYHHENNL